MFVRVKKHPHTNKFTVLICTTEQIEGHKRQTVMCTIGTSDDLQQIEKMKKTGEQLRHCIMKYLMYQR